MLQSLMFNITYMSFNIICENKTLAKISEGVALLRREISLKVICEKVKYSNSAFYNNNMTMNGHTSRLFKNIFYDVQTVGKEEINTA